MFIIQEESVLELDSLGKSQRENNKKLYIFKATIYCTSNYLASEKICSVSIIAYTARSCFATSYVTS